MSARWVTSFLVVLAACGDNIHPPGEESAARLLTEVSPARVTAGDTVTVTCIAYDAKGTRIGEVEAQVVLAPTDAGNTLTGQAAVMTHAGAYTAQCTLPDIEGTTAPFVVVHALPANLALSRAPDQIVYAVNQDIAIAHMVTDRYGNPIDDAVVTTASTPVAGIGPTTEPVASTYAYASEGRYRVDGTVMPPTDQDQAVTASVMIDVNQNGPTVLCDNDASMVDHVPGTPMTVTGTATDLNGVMSLTVNGTPVTPASDGSWSADVPTRYGMNFVELQGTDAFGVSNTNVCTYLVSNTWKDPAATIGDTVSLALTQGAVDDNNRGNGLNSFADMLFVVLNSIGLHTTLDSALTSANPLKPMSCDSQTCTFLGCICWYSSEVDYQGQISLPGPNTVSLNLVDGGLHAQVHVPNVGVYLRVHGKVSGIGYDTTGWVNVSYIDVGLTLDTSLVNGKPRVSVRPNSVATGVGSISTNFNGLDGWIINNIVVPLAQGSLRSMLANLIQGFVVNNFNSVLDGVVSSLDISTLGSTFNVPRLDGSGSVSLGFGLGFSTLNANPSRVLFGIGTKFTSTVANAYPTLGVPVPAGSILLDPTMNAPSTLGVGAHIAIIEGALHALWKANYLAATIDGTLLGANPGTTIVISTRLPPVVDILANGTVQLQLGALDATIHSPDLPDGLTVRVGADAHASVALTGNDLTFGGLALDAVHLSTPSGNLTASEQAALEGLIQQLAGQVITQSLNNSLPALPIPSFTLPAGVSQFGLPGGASLGITNPSLQVAPEHFTLRGQLGVQ